MKTRHIEFVLLAHEPQLAAGLIAEIVFKMWRALVPMTTRVCAAVAQFVPLTQFDPILASTMRESGAWTPVALPE